MEWNSTSCDVVLIKAAVGKGVLPETTTFDIEEPTNEPALSFYTRLHVESIKIPELNRTIVEKQYLNETCLCYNITEVKDDPECNNCDTILQNLDTAKKGLEGWMTALGVENTTYNNLDPSKAINNWFVQFGENEQTADLAPQSLMEKGEKLKNDILPADKEDTPIKRIQFSGGGNMLSMELAKGHEYEFTELGCWEGCNNESEVTFGSPGIDEGGVRVFGVGTELRFRPAEATYHVLHESTISTTNSDETTISFSLGDEDIDDEFVVDLYYDDVYGSIIFKTVSIVGIVDKIFSSAVSCIPFSILVPSK